MVVKEDYFVMSDGVKLFTRIVLPEENKKFPIVFIRTPYEQKRNGVPYPADEYENNLFIKNGYAIVCQHTRGRGDSEGECIPYQERQDGIDSLEKIRSLPFYNGEIYLTGESYLATVHFAYLDMAYSDIKAAALSIQTDRMYYRNYRNGCCYDYCNLNWWLGMLKNRYPNQNSPKDAIHRPYYKIMERIVGEDVPEYTEMLLNDTYNSFWESDPRTYVVENLTIPVLFTEGWYDFYTDGMFSMWERLPSDTKKNSVFVVGPWGHATKINDAAEYPLEHGNISDDYIVKFFNSIRENTPYNEFKCGKVNYYSVGGDFWTTDAECSDSLKLYFNNDNTLSDKSTVKGEQSYEYDPDKAFDYYKYGNIFKAPMEGSTDGVLSFVSSPSKKDIDFYGKIHWNMKVKSNCDDTAFFMRVYFVEDGVSYNLTETITALSHINKNYIANDECTISIDTPPIGFTLKKGNRIRVDISSHSNLYVPHSNTKEHWAKGTQTKISKNTVMCDENAYILLSITDRKNITNS